MGLKAAVALTAMLWASNASGGYITFSQWEAMQPTQQAVYMAGAFDTLTGYASNDADSRRAMHYLNCVTESKMNNGQLADNVLAFAKTKPELQRFAPQAALIQYLIKLCGKPPE